MLGIEGIIVGAATTLFGATAMRWRFFLSRGVRDESAISRGVRDAESAVCENPGPGRPGRVRGQDAPDHGQATAVMAARAPRSRPTLDAYMPAAEHVERFVSWAIVDHAGRPKRVRKSYAEMYALYLEWSVCHYVVPLPEKTFQTNLAKHEQVARKRDPLKDPATGRILRKPSGAPKRVTNYTINLPRVRPVLPGTVPVGDVVAKRPVETKKQRDAKKAAQLGQPLPEVIAA